MLKKIMNYLESEKTALRYLSDQIWEHPELGFQEKFACATLKAFLEERGFKVENPFCGLETAFRTEYGNGNGPVMAVCAEYDALAGLGHGCGHNLIAASGIGAFCAIAAMMKESNIPGKVVLLGTPAEESLGGKVKMVDAGCLKGIDAVIMTHPSTKTCTDAGCTAATGYQVTFHGKPAHAGGSPWKGINALDAVMLLYAAMNAYRQQMPHYGRLHGIVTDGGAAPNIIPDSATCKIYLRSGVEEWLPELDSIFKDMVKGAALMTRTQYEISEFHPLYRCRKPNATLNALFGANMEALGMEVKYPTEVEGGSSDFGNFSQVIPGIHPYYNVVEEHPEKVAGHSIEMREASHSDFGFNNMLKACASIADCAFRFLSDAEFRSQVKKDFQR